MNGKTQSTSITCVSEEHISFMWMLLNFWQQKTFLCYTLHTPMVVLTVVASSASCESSEWSTSRSCPQSSMKKSDTKHQSMYVTT